MKVLSKIILAVSVISLIGFSSCSKNSYSHNYNKKRGSGSSTINPVAQKKEPVRKNFVIPGKKKKILGEQKSKI